MVRGGFDGYKWEMIEKCKDVPDLLLASACGSEASWLYTSVSGSPLRNVG